MHMQKPPSRHALEALWFAYGMHSQDSKVPKVRSGGWTWLSHTAPCWPVAGWQRAEMAQALTTVCRQALTAGYLLNQQIKRLPVTKAIHPLFPPVVSVSIRERKKATALQGRGGR